MRVCLLILASICVFSEIQAQQVPVSAPAAQERPMTNADVIELTSLGLSDDVIVQKISTSKAVSFDTSLEGLKALKAAKVGDSVLKSMMTQQAAVAAAAPPTIFHSSDGKVRIYVTDHPISEVTAIIRGSSASHVHVDASPSGASATGNSVSSVGGVSHAQNGDDPRTVEIYAKMQDSCPAYVLVSNNPERSDLILVFRREGGKRSSFFAFGGLAGLGLSAASKVDGASLFQPNGDMIFATRENTVQKAIRETCTHIPPPLPPA